MDDDYKYPPELLAQLAKTPTGLRWQIREAIRKGFHTRNDIIKYIYRTHKIVAKRTRVNSAIENMKASGKIKTISKGVFNLIEENGND